MRTRVLHTNRLRHCYIPGTSDTAALSNQREDDVKNDWSPPAIEHLVLLPPEVPQESARRYPQTHHRPPERYTHDLVTCGQASSGRGKCNIH